jgi:hypothetical protein
VRSVERVSLNILPTILRNPLRITQARLDRRNPGAVE